MFSLLAQLVCAALFLKAIWSIFRHSLTRSTLDNLPGPKSKSWLKGHFEEILNPRGWEFHAHLANQYGPTVRIQALMGMPQVYTFDPKVMHTILLKEQASFDENDQFIVSNALVLGKGILGTRGEVHRKQRKMLNPVFSAAHLRDLVPIFYDVIHKMRESFEKKVQDGPQEIDVLSWMGRTALELIGQAGLGYSFDPLTNEATAHPYSKAIKELLPTMMRLAFWRTYVLPWAVNIGTPKFRRFIINMSPVKDMHLLRDLTDYMYNLSTEVIEGKRRALEEGDEAVAEQIGRGKDILSILMKENMKADSEDKLGEEELIGQMSSLIFAAMDTTSNALARTLHLLAQHPDAQEKLREEISAARAAHGGELQYNELTALPYLDAICRETLRLYSPAPFVARIALEDTVVPLHTPITGLDGKEIRELTITRGTNVLMSIVHANRNPALWGDDALEWKPERWLSPLPQTVVDARMPGVYSHLMTFLGGSRSCIGFKFSQLEMKAVLAVLIESFRFSPSKRDSEVFWQMNFVVNPCVGDDLRSQLPLNISLVKSHKEAEAQQPVNEN